MQIDMNNPATRRDFDRLRASPNDPFKIVFSWLVGTNQRRIAIAKAVLANGGPGMMRAIVFKVLSPRMSDSRRLQLLRMMEELGRPLDVLGCYALSTAMFRFGPELRDQIMETLLRCQPRNDAAGPASNTAVRPAVNCRPAS